MSGTSVEPIFIRAASKSNGITSLVLGCVALVVALVVGLRYGVFDCFFDFF